MKILETIKQKIKALAKKIAGEPAVPPEPNFATIYIIKNGEEVYRIESTADGLPDGIIKMISYFSKFNDYKIFYDYLKREIIIYFTVKKSNDVEIASSSENK